LLQGWEANVVADCLSRIDQAVAE